MPSVSELMKKAESKGIIAKSIVQKEDNWLVSTEMKLVMDSYVLKTPETVLADAQNNLEGFLNYWSGDEWAENRKLDTPMQYVENANTLFKSYSRLRKDLDSSVSFIIGDWLLECKAKFFPEAASQRKEILRWSKFLHENLSPGFSKTTAYMFMRIARELKEVRGKSLSWRQMLAALTVKSKGISISEIETLSESEIRALIKPEGHSSVTKMISRSHVSLVSIRKNIEKLNDLEKLIVKKQISILKQELISMLSSIDKHFFDTEAPVQR